MTTKIYITFALIFLGYSVYSQCEKEISTDPDAPINTEFLNLANEWYSAQGPYTVNSFLNQWSWYPPSNTQFNLNLTQGWANNMIQSLSFPMDNPFFATGTTTFIHQQASNYQYRDFRWEDGWELLWINMGIHPNLDEAVAPSTGSYYDVSGISSNPLPNNVPYFVLYNRYRGVLRIFANVWTDNLQPNAQEVLISLGFDDFAADANGLSGILRHSINYDTPLDQPTSGIEHFSPRMQATNTSSFLVADFQMGFDPCICLKETNPTSPDLGKLEFDFQTTQTMEIDMISRGVSVQEPIESASFTDDFYNLSEINTENYEPGHRIYTKMDGLYEDYLEKLQKYQEEMNAQNDDFNFIKAFLEKVAPALTNEFIGAWTIDEVVDKIKEDDEMAELSDEEVENILEEQRKKHELNFNSSGSFGTKALQSLTKGLLGIGFDYLNLELFPKKSTPVKPTTPVATFTETLYKGTINNSNVATSSQLYQPGGVTFVNNESSVGWGHGIVDLDYRNMPAYNVVLGQAALLTTPETEFFFKTESAEVERSVTGDYVIVEDDEFQWLSYPVVQEMTTPFDLKFRVTDEMKVALNSSLDFDLEQTNSYVSLEIELVNEMTPSNTWDWWDEISDEIVTHNFDNSDFSVTNYFQTDNGRTLQLNSVWVPLSELNQYVYYIHGEESIDIHGWFPAQDFPPIDPDFPPFDPVEVEYEVSRIKIKVMHDFYFDQVGHLGEQINTSQLHTYLMYDQEQNINLLSNLPAEWNNMPAEGVFDEYLPGIAEVGDTDIAPIPADPLVHEVVNGNTFIRAKEIVVIGDVTVVPVPENETLTLEALKSIHLKQGTHLNTSYPERIHLKIKKDFYDTPIFEYADNAAVYNFCNDPNVYQANVDARAFGNRVDEQLSDEAINQVDIQKTDGTTLMIYPNPARSELRAQAEGAVIEYITIFDMSNRPIMQASPGGQDFHQMDISTLSPGVYIVRADCGGEILTEKLVVAK